MCCDYVQMVCMSVSVRVCAVSVLYAECVRMCVSVCVLCVHVVSMLSVCVRMCLSHACCACESVCVSVYAVSVWCACSAAGVMWCVWDACAWEHCVCA